MSAARTNRRRSRGRGILALTILGSACLATPACSLSGVAEFDLPQCKSDAECRAAFNAQSGFYADCAAFACKLGSCQRIEGEVCDGADNDCDYLVDEPNGSTSPIAPELEVLWRDVDSVLSVTPLSSSGTAGIYVQGEKGASFVDPTAAGVPPQASFFTSDQVKDIDLIEGCLIPDGERAECNVRELSVASGAKLGFFAEITTDGCTSGTLRVGAIEPQQPTKLIDRGPGVRSPSSWGVRATRARCTNNGTVACEAAVSALEDGTSMDPKAVIDACGVTQPSVAALSNQALVTFVAQGDNRAKCGGPIAEVQALLLHERIGVFGAPFAWADPSGDGFPDTLGRTRGGSQPAVVAVGQDGFVVGHGTEAGSLRLVWVPRQAPPPENSGTTCPAEGCESREGVSTSALSGFVELGRLDAEEAHAVALSWLSLGSGKGALGVAWLDGCGSNAEAKMQVTRGRVVDGSLELASAGPVLSLGRSDERPVVLGASRGFVVKGYERGGAVATREETGGFYVITHTSSGSVATRVTAFDGERLDKSERIILGGDKDLRVLGALPGDEPSFVAHSATSASLSAGSLSCQ